MIIGRYSKQYVTSLVDLDCLCIYLLIICYVPGPLLVCAYSSSDYVTSLVLVLLVTVPNSSIFVHRFKQVLFLFSFQESKIKTCS